MFVITGHVYYNSSFVGVEQKTRVFLLDDFSLQISPVEDSDFEIWRCVQHVSIHTSEKSYKLFHGKSECVQESVCLRNNKYKKDTNYLVTSLKGIIHPKPKICQPYVAISSAKHKIIYF